MRLSAKTFNIWRTSAAPHHLLHGCVYHRCLHSCDCSRRWTLGGVWGLASVFRPQLERQNWNGTVMEGLHPPRAVIFFDSSPHFRFPGPNATQPSNRRVSAAVVCKVTTTALTGKMAAAKPPAGTRRGHAGVLDQPHLWVASLTTYNASGPRRAPKHRHHPTTTRFKVLVNIYRNFKMYRTNQAADIQQQIPDGTSLPVSLPQSSWDDIVNSDWFLWKHITSVPD